MKILVPLVALLPLGLTTADRVTGQLLYSPAKTIATADAPGSVALRPAGGFVVSVPAKRRVLFYKADGSLERTVAMSIRPSALAVKNNGQLLIGDTASGDVGVYDPQTGNRVGFLGAGPGEFGEPADIAIDRWTHTIYVVDGKRDHVRVFRWDGMPLSTIGSRGQGQGQFRSPVAVTVQQSTGDVFVSDFYNGRVHIFDKKGVYLSAFGVPPYQSWFSKIAPGYLYRNAGVAVDAQGRVLIADIFSGWVQAFSRTGQYLGLCAVYGRTAGKLMVPGDIEIDVANRLIATSSVGSATSSTEVEVFDNVAGGKLTINTTPQPTTREATVSTEPFYTSMGQSTHTFRVEFWGASVSQIDRASIRMNNKFEAVGIEPEIDARPGSFTVQFRQRDLLQCIRIGHGDLEVTITGTLKGGGQFSGTTALITTGG